MRWRWLALWTAVILATSIIEEGVARACAPAPPEHGFVDIVSEEALIVWDAARKREHFVRRASFHSDSEDFGFLVPTPSKPELAEAEDAIFQRLRSAIAPEVVRKEETTFAWTLCTAVTLLASRGADSAVPEAASAVEVLGTARVAGLDAVSLAAKDADALGTWLGDHGYHFRPELKSWLQTYLDQDWVITAFKIAGDQDGPIGSKALRMSFDTAEPFYPYREPEDQRTKVAAYYEDKPTGAPSRTLRVYLLAPARYAGTLAQHGPWPAEVEWAAPPKHALDLSDSVPDGAVPDGAWLHAFVDRASPRPGTADLFFAEATTQEQLVPPPVVVYDENQILIPLDLVAFVLLLGYLGWRLARRRKDEPAPR